MNKATKLTKEEGLILFGLESQSQKISTKRPRKRRWRCKSDAFAGAKSARNAGNMEVDADRYTRAQPDAPDKREIHHTLHLVVQVDAG